jgi:hypothetical protein
MDRRKLRTSIAAIDEVLWRDWDPIGINGVLEARGEYSSYVSGVFSLLQTGASDADLMSYLSGIESGRMGLDPRPPQSLQPVVTALRAAYRPDKGLQGTSG